MKILIASDLHGSSYYAKKIIEIYALENAEKIVLLGDVYNHGPRNSLPKDYQPMEVAKTLNAVKENLIVIKGNCDSAVDTMISEFDFIEDACLLIGKKSVFLTHGHVYNIDNQPKTRYSAIIYGHFHTGFIERKNNVIVANTGSLSLPKNHTPNSYIIIDEQTIVLKDLDGNIIKAEKY